MQAARYYGNRDIRIDAVDSPTPGPDEVLIDVGACGICGSDLAEYLHGPRHGGDHLPYTMGHELGGTVVETGNHVEIDTGTDIVLNPLIACESCWACAEAKYNLCQNLTVIGAHRPGGYAEQVVAPATNVVPLPPDIGPAMAAVSEPYTVAFHAIQQSPLRPGQSVAVIGMGPIGIGLVQLARAAGADPIVASGHRESRRNIARASGADVVLDPREVDPAEQVRDTLDIGVDVAFEVAGRESSINDAISVTKPSGHVTLVGVFKGDVSFDPMDFVNAERSMNASAAYRTGPLADRDFGAVLDQFASGMLEPEQLVTSRIDLADIEPDGFEALADRGRGEVKVLVEP